MGTDLSDVRPADDAGDPCQTPGGACQVNGEVDIQR